MSWTPQQLAAAYRLTETDALIAAALQDAEYRVRRYLGEPASVIRCRWEIPFWEFGQYALGLPRLTQSMSAVEVNNVAIDDAYLSDGGWTMRRRDPLGFFGARLVEATLNLVNDDDARDDVLASMALDLLGGEAAAVGGWRWRRLVNDWRGPGPPYRLPDNTTVTQGGGGGSLPGQDSLYIGVLDTQNEAVDLSVLSPVTTGLTSTRLTIPAFTGRKYLFVAGRTERPLSALSVGAGGLNILPTFVQRQEAAVLDGQLYDLWVSGVPYLDTAASGVAVTVTR